MEKLALRTNKRSELVDITERVQAQVSKSEISSGTCLIFCPHTTAGLTINENADPSVKSDMINSLNRLVPEWQGYEHGEGNADSHVKSSLFGASLAIFVESGKLILGRWQGIYFCESDGPRQREVWIKIIKDK